MSRTRDLRISHVLHVPSLLFTGLSEIAVVSS
jgi:hypothetical protein